MSTDRPTEPPGFGRPPIARAPGEEPDGLDEQVALSPPARPDDDHELLDRYGVPSALMEAKRGIEEALRTRTAEAAAAGVRAAEAFRDMRGIQGVAIGLGKGGASGGQGAARPGEPALTVYTLEPARAEAVRSILSDAMGVEAVSARAEVPLNVVPTGVIEAAPHRFPLRPAPGGSSVGHFRVTAGTIGCLAFGRTPPRDERLLVLSNNHVLADTNAAAFGDCVCQPGPVDLGTCPDDQIAITERFVPIDFQGTNFVDCATAWADPELVRPELIYLDENSVPQFFNVGNVPVAPSFDMPVGKSGRTTQVTYGQVSGLAASVSVDYQGRVALFAGQMAITPARGYNAFSAGGDSGSLIWTTDRDLSPVGLLFAGSTAGEPVTFANPIETVITALDISLYTV